MNDFVLTEKYASVSTYIDQIKIYVYSWECMNINIKIYI